MATGSEEKPKKRKPKYYTYKPPKIPEPAARRHPVIDFHVNIGTKAESSRPIDYTFKKYKRLNKAAVETASSGRLGLIDRGPTNKFISRSLWLNNNFIENVHNLSDMVNSVMEFPDRLGFLDLSCNEIKEINDDLLKYKNIVVLYLHGNNLNNLIDLVQLSKLKKMRSLTLYGNPIYNDTSYGNIRVVVAQFIPHLKKLDFNGIKKLERECPMSTRALKFFNKFHARTQEMKKAGQKISIDELRSEQFEPWRVKMEEEAQKKKNNVTTKKHVTASKQMDDSSKLKEDVCAPTCECDKH